MASTAGHRIATSRKTTLFPRAMFLATWSAMTTSTITALGAMSLSMATFGTREKLPWAGLLTVMATGIGSARGAGLGWTIHPGALLPTTTAAGPTSAAGGAGALGRSTELRSTGLLSWAFSVADSVLESAGSHSATANRTSHGSVAAAVSERGSTFTTRSFATGMSSTRTFATSIT